MRTGYREVIPQSTIDKPPSAELRPDQKDTDSLPPYEVLDPILEAYVERYCSAEQIARDQGVDVALVRSVLQLVERCEYKRQQAAPVLEGDAQSPSAWEDGFPSRLRFRFKAGSKKQTASTYGGSF